MRDYSVNIFWDRKNLDMFHVMTFIVPNTDNTHICNRIEYTLSRSFGQLYNRAKLEARLRVKNTDMCVDAILDPAGGRLLVYTINHHTGEVDILRWKVDGARGQWLGLKADSYY